MISIKCHLESATDSDGLVSYAVRSFWDVTPNVYIPGLNSQHATKVAFNPLEAGPFVELNASQNIKQNFVTAPAEGSPRAANRS